MVELTPTQMGISIADSLTGYIAHIPGSVSCRHCELAQEIADALRTVEQATERRAWEEAAEIARTRIGNCATNDAIEAGKNIVAAEISNTLSRRAGGRP